MSRPELNDTSAAVLAYLSSGPVSGWDIARGLESLIGDFWNITTSQVYRELQTLAANGLVDPGPAGARSRRPYSLTDAGRTALDTWLAAEPSADVVRIPLLLKMFLLFRLRPQGELDEFLARYSAVHEENLRRYEAKLAEFESQGAPDADLVRYGVLHERAVIEWAAATRKNIKRRAAKK